LSFSNDRLCVAQLKSELGEGDYLITIEASGRYEALARHELEAAGHRVRLQNPRQVRRLAEGMGSQAKTDLIDAQILARTAELCADNEPRSKEREMLGDISPRANSLGILSWVVCQGGRGSYLVMREKAHRAWGRLRVSKLTLFKNC